MKREDLWALDFCYPASWTVDMSPPAGDWDEEFEPGTYEYNIRQVGMQFSVNGQQFVHAIQVVSQQFGKSLAEAGKEIMALFTPVADKLEEELKPITEVMQQLMDEEMKKHGNHRITSIDPKIKLPERLVNSGPPLPRFDRRKK